MQNISYIYLVDNKIQCFCKKEQKYYEYVMPRKILEYGKIIHRPKFAKELQSFLRKNHLIKKFQKNILYFITPPNFYETDKEIIIKVFEELPFQEIKIIKEVETYHLKKNTLWININLDYMFMSYLEKHTKIHQLIINNYLNYNFLEQIKIFLKNNPKIKKVYLFGTNPLIPNMVKELEQKTDKIFLYFENYENYILNKFIRHNLP